MRQIHYFLTGLIIFVLVSGNVLAFQDDEIKLDMGDSLPETQYVSMDFDSAPLKDVLKILSEQSGINFVASNDVEEKKVTVYFDNVPVKDAFEGIITANNLKYEKKDSGMFVIYTSSPTLGVNETAAIPLETRVFQLKYSRLSSSPMDVGGNSVVDELKTVSTVNSTDESTGSSTTGSTTSGTSTGSNSSGSSGSSSSTSNNNTSAGNSQKRLTNERGIDVLVASILSPNGKVAVDLHSNSLIITDTPTRLAEIEEVLSKIDVPTAQVMIEVQMMEIKKGLIEDHGVEWGGTDGQIASFTGGKISTSFPMLEGRGRIKYPITIDPISDSNNIGVTDNNGKKSLQYSVLDATSLAAVLHLITTDSHTKILAKPRVLTLNNEAANIKLVTKTVVGETTTTTSAQSLATSTANQPIIENTGITLLFTPQINQDETISLFLQPSITTVSASALFPTSFLEPTTRTVRTTVRLKNHQTLLLGGLIDNSESVTNQKVPVLGDLPVIGSVFNYKHTSGNDREFIIFITPHIVRKYDSLATPSATAVDGQDMAMRRVLDSFAESQMKKEVYSVQQSQILSRSGNEKEIKRLREGAKDVSGPVSDHEMSRMLDAMTERRTKI